MKTTIDTKMKKYMTNKLLPKLLQSMSRQLGHRSTDFANEQNKNYCIPIKRNYFQGILLQPNPNFQGK